MVRLDPTKLRKYFNQAKLEKDNFDRLYEMVSFYVIPHAYDYHTSVDAGPSYTNPSFRSQAYTSAPTLFAHTFASALLGMMFSPNQDWLILEAGEVSERKKDLVKAWMQQASEAVMEYQALPKSNFYPAVHEALWELVVYGQSGVMADRNKNNHLKFKSVSIRNTYVTLDADQEVDTVYRRSRLTKEQILKKWPEPKQGSYKGTKLDLENLTFSTKQEHFNVIHAVMPREGGRLFGMDFEKPFMSVWFLEEALSPNPEDDPVLSIQGLDYFPYANPRFSLLPEESYGRGAGVWASSDMAMVNEISKDLTKAIQLKAVPPMGVVDRSLVEPLDMSPFAQNTIRPSTLSPRESIFALGQDGDPSFGLELLERHVQQIGQFFMMDKLTVPQKSAEMREVEFLGREQESMRELTPLMQRLHNELAEPLVMFTINYLIETGRIPEPPVGVSLVNIKFNGPLVQAQRNFDTESIIDYFQRFIVPLAQADVGVLDLFKIAAISDYISDKRNFPVKLTRTEEELAQLQQDKQNQQMLQQAQQAAEVGESLSGSFKNLADAQNAGGLF